MKCREREGWLSEQRYVSGWSNVANSEGGANVGRVILRKQEWNLNAVGHAQRKMGRSERIRQARRGGTLQTVDCNIDSKRQIKTCGSPEVERRIN